jgi:hypothetical protein
LLLGLNDIVVGSIFRDLLRLCGDCTLDCCELLCGMSMESCVCDMTGKWYGVVSLCVACGSGRGRTSSSGVGCTVGATATGDAGITLLGRASGRCSCTSVCGVVVLSVVSTL